jgi:hypothetical protein
MESWPGYDGYVEVVETVFRERTKLSALAAVRTRKDAHRVPKRMTA